MLLIIYNNEINDKNNENKNKIIKIKYPFLEEGDLDLVFLAGELDLSLDIDLVTLLEGDADDVFFPFFEDGDLLRDALLPLFSVFFVVVLFILY